MSIHVRTYNVKEVKKKEKCAVFNIHAMYATDTVDVKHHYSIDAIIIGNSFYKYFVMFLTVMKNILCLSSSV
jgi:hypothetical protein